jgi:hypothetical protein
LQAIIPVIPASSQKAARGTFKALKAGRELTALHQSDLLRELPDLIFSNPSRQILNASYGQVRNAGIAVPIGDRLRISMGRIKPRVMNKLRRKLDSQDTELGGLLDTITGRTTITPTPRPGSKFPGQPTRQVIPAQADLDIGDVHALRSRLLRAERAMELERKTEAGASSPEMIQAVKGLRREIDQSLDRVQGAGANFIAMSDAQIASLPPSIQQAAIAARESAQGVEALRASNLLARQLDAHEAMTDAIQQVQKSSKVDLVVNVNDLNTTLSKSAFDGFQETLDLVPNARRVFEGEMRAIDRLSRGTLRVATESFETTHFGRFTLIIPNMISQVLVNRVSRRRLIEWLRITGGGEKITVPVAAALLSGIRGGATANQNPLDPSVATEFGQNMLSKIKESIAPKTQQATQPVQAPTQQPAAVP